MPQLILLRHGQSEWNLENRFTGWHDVDLTEQGEAEARRAGRLLRAHGMRVERAFTSVLRRAIRTLWLALEELDRVWIPEEKDWRLNERHYGALTGLNKAETAAEYGEEQVHIWRRSYDVPPPALKPEDDRHPRHDPRYSGIPQEQLPATESLKTTLDRVLPYWNERVVPALHAHDCMLVAAHGNSIRALVKHLDGLDEEGIMSVEIPTGVPLVYDLDDALDVRGSRYLEE